MPVGTPRDSGDPQGQWGSPGTVATNNGPHVFLHPLTRPGREIMPSLGTQMKTCLLLVFRKGPLLEWWQHLQMTEGFCLHMAFKWPASTVKCSQAWHLKHSVLGIWSKSLSGVWPCIQLTPWDVAGFEHNCRSGEHPPSFLLASRAKVPRSNWSFANVF